GVDLDNSDGTIIASGAGSVDFLGTTIHGGTLQSMQGGSLWFLRAGLSPATAPGGVSNAAMLDGTTTPLALIGETPQQLGTSFVLDATFAQGAIQTHTIMRVIGSLPNAAALAQGFQNRTGALVLSGDVTLENGGVVDLERPGNALSNGLNVGIAS